MVGDANRAVNNAGRDAEQNHAVLWAERRRRLVHYLSLASSLGRLRSRLTRRRQEGDVLLSALERQNDAEQNALVRTHLPWSADVSATIGRDHIVDLVVGNSRPRTVHFNLVVVANHAALGRPTIHQIAARASAIISFEFRVEVAMPFIVAYPVVSLLRRRVHTKKQEGPAAEKRDEVATPHGLTQRQGSRIKYSRPGPCIAAKAAP